MNISVCMATRNGERFIAEQLASILPQLEADDEVVISDDSSPDRTVAIIRAFADRRIRLLAGNTFFSPIYNLENALRQATGAIVALADQDDLWLANKIPAIRRSLAPKVQRPALLALDAQVIDGAGQQLHASLFALNNAGPGLFKNLYDNTYTGCTLACTRPLLEIALPFPAGIPMHDSWLGLLAEIHGETAFVREPTMRYRRHGTNVSRRQPLHRQIGGRLCLAWHLLHRSLNVRKNRRTPLATDSSRCDTEKI